MFVLMLPVKSYARHRHHLMASAIAWICASVRVSSDPIPVDEVEIAFLISAALLPRFDEVVRGP